MFSNLPSSHFHWTNYEAAKLLEPKHLLWDQNVLVLYVKKSVSDYLAHLYLLGSMKETRHEIAEVKDKSHKNIMHEKY